MYLLANVSSFVAWLSNKEWDLVVPSLKISYGTRTFIIKFSLNAQISSILKGNSWLVTCIFHISPHYTTLAVHSYSERWVRARCRGRRGRAAFSFRKCLRLPALEPMYLIYVCVWVLAWAGHSRPQQATAGLAVRRLKGSYIELYFSVRTLDT